MALFNNSGSNIQWRYSHELSKENLQKLSNLCKASTEALLNVSKKDFRKDFRNAIFDNNRIDNSVKKEIAKLVCRNPEVAGEKYNLPFNKIDNSVKEEIAKLVTHNPEVAAEK